MKIKAIYTKQKNPSCCTADSECCSITDWVVDKDHQGSQGLKI